MSSKEPSPLTPEKPNNLNLSGDYDRDQANGSPISLRHQSPTLSSSKKFSQSTGSLKVLEDKFLAQYGLDAIQLEKSQGQSVLPHVLQAVSMLNDSSSKQTLGQMLFLSKQLLNWFEMAAPAVKSHVFDHHANAFLSKIRSLLTSNTSSAPPSNNTTTEGETVTKDEEAIIVQQIGRNLTLLLSEYCKEVPAFKEKVQAELMNCLKQIITQQPSLQELDDEEEGDEETPASIRTSSLFLLIHCLPVVADDESELKQMTWIYVELSKLGKDTAPYLTSECLDRLHQITIVKDSSLPSLMETHFPSLLSLLEMMDGKSDKEEKEDKEVEGEKDKEHNKDKQKKEKKANIMKNQEKDKIFTILKNCSRFFNEESQYFINHLNIIIDKIGLIDDQLTILLEKILEKNVYIIQFIQSIPSFLIQLSKNAMKQQLVIMGIFLAIALMDVKPFLSNISTIFQNCFVYPYLFLPLCKLFAVIGKYSGDSTIAINILQQLGKLVKSGKVIDSNVQSAILETFHIVKDVTGYSGLLSEETLKILESYASTNPMAYQHILAWNQGKRSRIGSDVKAFIVTAGTVHAASGNSKGCFLLPCASRNTSSTAVTPAMMGNKNSAVISPTPFSQDLARAQATPPAPLITSSEEKKEIPPEKVAIVTTPSKDVQPGDEEEKGEVVEEGKILTAAAVLEEEKPEKEEEEEGGGGGKQNEQTHQIEEQREEEKKDVEEEIEGDASARTLTIPLPTITDTSLTPPQQSRKRSIKLAVTSVNNGMLDLAYSTPQVEEEEDQGVVREDKSNELTNDIEGTKREEVLGGVGNSGGGGLVVALSHLQPQTDSTNNSPHPQPHVNDVITTLPTTTHATEEVRAAHSTEPTQQSEYNPAHEIPVPTSRASSFLTKWFSGGTSAPPTNTSSNPSTVSLLAKSKAKVGIDPGPSFPVHSASDSERTSHQQRPDTAPTMVAGMTPNGSIRSMDEATVTGSERAVNQAALPSH